MAILRLCIGAIYDIGRIVSILSILAGMVYSTRGIFLDSPADGRAAVTYFTLSIGFWTIARVFRRYAI